MFEYFETTSRTEREEIAANLQALYDRIASEEAEAWQTMRNARTKDYETAQKSHIAAISKLGTIQAVFHELGIPFAAR